MFWNLIKRLFARPAQGARAWVPWPPEKLAQVHARLSTLTPPLSEEDGTLVIEWLINRYQPHGVMHTEADYQRAIATMRNKVRHNLASPVSPRRWVDRVDVEVPGELRHRIYALYRKMGIPLSFVDRAFNDNWRNLEAGRLNGSQEASGVVPYNETCRIAIDMVMDRKYPIHDLLTAYEHPDGPVPILPHPFCERLNPKGENSVEYCRCCWSMLPAPVPGADPEFMSWMSAELDKVSGRTLPIQIREDGERTIAVRREQLKQETERDLEAARNKLGVLQDSPACLTAESIVSCRSMDEWRAMQRRHRGTGLRKKLDVVRQLLYIPAALPELQHIADEEHGRQVKETLAEIAYLQKRLHELQSPPHQL